MVLMFRMGSDGIFKPLCLHLLHVGHSLSRTNCWGIMRAIHVMRALASPQSVAKTTWVEQGNFHISPCVLKQPGLSAIGKHDTAMSRA
jgi:hypothetical protein